MYKKLLALMAMASAAVAQNSTFLDGLMGTLSNAGASSLTQLAGQLNSSSQGKDLLKAISNGDSYVLFAPNDTALSNAPSNLTQNTVDLFSYHVVHGNFSNQSTTYPNTTVGRTFLNGTTWVSLEGNKSQVVVWATRDDGKVHVLNQGNDSIVTDVKTYGNVTIYIVSSVLAWPDNFSDTLGDDSPYLEGAGSLAANVSEPFYNASDSTTSNQTVQHILDYGFKGFTFFAPNTSAIQARGGSITTYEQNATLMRIILDNHVINGTSVYSPELVGQEYTSAAGQKFSFSTNSTGQYVKLGSVTARIIQPDVILSNGVAHVIDQVLLDTDEDASAASSAAESATSAAGQSTTETRPIGYSETQGFATGSVPASSASGSHSAGLAVRGPSKGQMVAFGFTAIGLVADPG
ncbi:hypothetical protein FOMPIDRAFT_90532 [Fomitopsis schrenkii]|uniref:FAS1 domain-containing protein n=1 Tax=Fomitopsis schrenkii TaxID=2126942 RepID=S8DX58_FOMSC|nr:hypothetical protein FOMPIDRAFT_90532 [Fomitopsis schrenkii]